MDMSLQERFGSSTRGVLVGLGVLVCFALATLVLADVSAAAVPPTGLNCVASDGKISGRGASVQAHAETAFAEAYRDDYCGNTGSEEPAGNTMLAYNYPAAEKGSNTGSGEGLSAASCRTDAYAGVSVPYTEAQWKQLNETPGKLEKAVCGITFEPPFQPIGKPYPNASDIAAPVMTVPVVGAAVAVFVNLPATDCEGTAPANPLEFTGKEVSRLFGGNVAKWSDSELVGTNPSLAKCNFPVTRIVREDSSGLSEFVKEFLVRAENERAGECDVGAKWSSFGKNTEWPGLQKPGKEGTCSEIKKTPSSGGPEEVKYTEETPGAIGYADLADATGHSLLDISDLQNATGTQFEAPNAGKAANCTFSVLALPGTTASDAVGLDPEDNYANNNEEVNHNPTHTNATDLGSKYPICGLGEDLVYTGLDNGSVANAISRLSADQRRTLYSYFSFVLSSTAQEKLGSINYAPLPSTWLVSLREGFQANF
jgi:ABC-type phosphate transport system substrate-binding protein